MNSRSIYTASRIFTGDNWLTDHAIVIKDGLIEEMLPASALPADLNRIHFDGGFLAPAFIDMQIYGAQERLLAVYPAVDSLAKLADHCRRGGAAWCLPAIATNSKDVFYRSIDAIKAYWKEGGAGILGLHLEGPWINTAKRGAHIASFIHAPTRKEVEELLAYGKGVIKMITLAPEICSQEIIDLILSENIIVAAGHSNATYQQAMDAFANGITAVTHLYNAMSPLQHRAPGLVGAAMEHDKVMVSIIPDGYHVDYAAIRIAKRLLKDRLYAITDAVTATKEGPYPHTLSGDKYESAGILSGSALTMQKALYNLVYHADAALDEALRMCSLYPATLARIDDRSGRLQPGYRAEIILLDDGLQVVTMIS